MSQAITVSDDLFARLEESAHTHGLLTIEQLLEAWQGAEDERSRRRAVVQELQVLRDRLYASHGEMPDSVDLLREDRGR